MGFSDKMRGMTTSMQDGAKNASVSLFCISLRLITGFMLGLTLGLIGQELVGYGTFALIFVMVVVLGLVMKVTSGWNAGKILILDLILVLVAMLLRMYILVAP